MNAIWDRDVNPPKDGSIINFERAMHMQMGVSEEDVEHLEQTPGSKLIEMTK